jgi:hypothetical protein
MAPDRNKMAQLHEQYLADLTGGRKSRASGSTWQDPADGRNNRITTEYAFAFDGKSTTTKSITLDRAMIAKLREQAGGERPMFGLRWYDTEDLARVGEDLVVITAADFGELLTAARLMAKTTQAVADTVRAIPEFPPSQPPPPVPHLGGLPPPPHELWPCTIIDARHVPEGSASLVSQGYYIDDNGGVTEIAVDSVRAEPIAEARYHLFVNEVLVRRGQLYIDGRLEVQVGGPA